MSIGQYLFEILPVMRMYYKMGFEKSEIALWLQSLRRSVVHVAQFLKFYVLLTVHPCITFFKWSQLGAHYFSVYLFQLLYMFRATMYSSSGELTVSMRHWYFSLWMGGSLVCWLGWDEMRWADQTATHRDWKIPVSHRYIKFSWRRAHSCPKHVEKLK